MAVSRLYPSIDMKKQHLGRTSWGELVRTGMIADHKKNTEPLGERRNQSLDDMLLDCDHSAAPFAIALLGPPPLSADRRVADSAARQS